MVKSYVEFQYQGISKEYFYEREISHRNPEKVEIPEECIGFRFLSYETMVIHGKEIKSERFDVSGWYYLGERFAVEEVKNRLTEEQYRRITMMGYKEVVVTDGGKVIPLRAIDQAIYK